MDSRSLPAPDLNRRPSGRRRPPTRIRRATWSFWAAGLIVSSTLLSALPTPVLGAARLPVTAPAPSLGAPAGNLVDNGSFEAPGIGVSYQEFDDVAQTLSDWTITNRVDLVSGMNWEIPAGNQVLDIDGSFAAPANGSIAQAIPTTPGTSYDVGFVYSGNPDCGDVGMVSMDVLWNGVVIGAVTHDTDNPGHTLADFDYQPFAASVAGAGGGAESTTLELRSNSGPTSTCGIVVDDVFVVHATPPVWQATGDGIVTVLNDGSSGAPKFSYNHDLGIGGGVSGEWSFYTTATTTETINVPYTYTGLHAWFNVTVSLEAFVISADASDTSILLVDDGPESCCTPPSSGFSYTGSVPLSVEPGDTYGFTMTGSNGDLNSFLNGTFTIGGTAPPPELLRAVSTGGTNATILGRVDGLPTTSITIAASTADTCTDGALDGGGAAGGAVTVATDDEGYFAANVTGVQPGDYVTARLTSPAVTADSACIVSSADNDFWPKALDLDGSALTAQDVIDSQGKARWYKFSVTPGQRIDVRLTGLPADYDLAVFKDIGKEFLTLLDPEDAQDLTKLSAEYAPSVFSPSVFSPSVFSPSVFSPDAYAPSVFSPSVFSPSVFSPSVFSPSVFSPSVFSPSVFSPSVFSPSVFSPSVFSPSVFSPSVFSPSVFSATEVSQAFSSAQTRTLIGVSASAGTGDETVIVNSFNNTGEFYVRVAGHAGAFDTGAQFTVQVAKGATDCAGVTDTTLTPRTDAAATGVKTVILTDSSKLALGTTSPGTLRSKLTTFAARTEVGGVLVDVASDARVAQLKTQANANKSCPFATNLLAEEIKGLVDSYRANNPGLRYVVVVGGDTVIPFFRYPDQSLLGQESGYVPPVRSDSISEAALRKDFVLSQDAYGSGVSVSLRTSDFPVPGLAVGRLIETPAEIAGMLDAYTAANGVVAPGSSLVTGYDFLADAADAVKTELQSGTGAAPDTLITPNGISPQDPSSWTATQLRTKLFGSRHDVMFLAGHFSANSALAADFATSVLTTELAASTVNLTNAIVFSAGCHSGYNLVDDEALPGVAQPLDWAQAFAQKKTTLIAGTGYQYGDTDFLEYSERLYRDFARELRAGTGVVSIGEALARAKLTYLATTPDIRGIHEKAILEATLFGLPMLGVNMPAGRGAVPGTGPAIDPTEAGPVNGTDLSLATHDLSLAPTLTPHSLNLKNPPYDAIPGTFTTASWLSGPTGVVTNPAEPALPLAAVNATSNNAGQVLRGVGFRGGAYTDASPVVPLTGAPTTELRGVHAPFTSPVFYPMRMWNSNYYGELGGSGGTNLLVTPVQHRADPANPGKSIRRTFSNLDLRLFYSSNLTTAALSDAPSIVGVSGQPNGGAIDFAIQVVGDPKTLIREVWITYTNGTGSWQPLDLTQDSADSSLWLGSLPSAGPNLQFVVQAASGLGLVAFDDNRGAYYTAATGAVAETTVTLISPPSSGTFGDSPTVTAELKAGATPLAGKSVIVSIGGSSVIATTGANGRVTTAIPLSSAPGTTQITASFGGDDAYAPSSDTASPFTIAKATSALSALTSQLAVVTPGGKSGVTSVLSASVGGKTQTLGSETVTFTLTGPSSKTFSTITDFIGKATLPTTGLVAGTYSVTASFAGNASYGTATRTGSLVISAFNGFLFPVVNPPKRNVVKAGAIVPLRFALGGDRGLAILASGSPVVTKIACATGVTDSTVAPDGTWPTPRLVYIKLIKQYVYVWKTPTSYKNSCYEFNLVLVDGSSHVANFKFK